MKISDYILDSDLEIDTTTFDTTPIELLPGEVDPRLKLLSHSSRELLHTCPRKYQLYKLSAESIVLDSNKEQESSITFAYGHAVGTGIQSVLEGKDEDVIILDVFLSWDTDLLEENLRQNKSFWLAVHAVKSFIGMVKDSFLEDYELVYHEDKPAIELSFKIIMPNGYTYRGFIDAVLRHKTTGAVIVLEDKTTSGTANASMYRNSGQALGYSVVLDKLFPNLAAYEVIYLVYETRSMSYKQLSFDKSLLQRALWLQELYIDSKIIDTYIEYESFPMHGESCFKYMEDCKYCTLCTMSTERLTKPLTEKILSEINDKEDDSQYDFVVSLEELINRQIEKGE